MIDWKNVAVKPIPISGKDIKNYIAEIEKWASVLTFCFQIDQPSPYPQIQKNTTSPAESYNLAGLFDNAVIFEHTKELQLETPVSAEHRWGWIEDVYLDGLLVKLLLAGFYPYGGYSGSNAEGKILSMMAAVDIMGFDYSTNNIAFHCDDVCPGKWFYNDANCDYFTIVFDNRQKRIWMLCITATD